MESLEKIGKVFIAVFRVLGSDLIIENALKNIEGQKSRKICIKKSNGTHCCYGLLWLCLGLTVYL